jgi:tetratricopeptide (TPR) repeat protein
MFERGWFNDLMPYTEIAMQILKDIEESQTLEAALILNTIGITYVNLNKPSLSLEYNQRVLEIRRVLLPPEDPAVLNITHNLSYSYAGLGDFTKAKQYCGDALSIREKLPDAKYAWYKKTSLARNYITSCRIALLSGDIDAAEIYGRKAIELSENNMGVGHPHTAL